MTTTFKTAMVGALITLSASAPPAVSAQESLQSRAVTLLGIVIAAQGDAALVQIRREIGDELRERLRPYLPARDADATPTPPARTPDAAR